VTIHLPQFIFLFFLIAQLVMDAGRDGEDKKGKHKFEDSLINVVVMFGILYWGNFFNQP